MKRATVLEQLKTPDGSIMTLVEHDGARVIRVNGRELMSTRHSFSEEQLGVVACQGLARKKDACVLIGGLGLGFTLRAALASLGRTARVVVAERCGTNCTCDSGPDGSLVWVCLSPLC